jgi:(S)-ureidoglycine aminohydrolase
VHTFGHTRSALRPDHYLQSPDTFIRAPLPGMQEATAIVHAGPTTGARFVEYTAEMQGGGNLGSTPLQRFIYVLEGGVDIEGHALVPGDFVYIPEAESKLVRAETTARLAVIEKEFAGTPAKPNFFTGKEANVASIPVMGDEALRVRTLVPDRPGFDFAVNIMTFDPGATLSLVEMHVMEHGLLMLEGGGIYRLGDFWYPVQAGDFIYMAPFCPQWFGCLGKSPAKYLIYKDWNRHPAE